MLKPPFPTAMHSALTIALERLTVAEAFFAGNDSERVGWQLWFGRVLRAWFRDRLVEFVNTPRSDSGVSVFGWMFASDEKRCRRYMLAGLSVLETRASCVGCSVCGATGAVSE